LRNSDLRAASVAQDQGKTDDAIRLYTEALKDGDLAVDQQAFAHNCRGIAYKDEKQYPQAIADFDAAIF